MRSLFTKHRGQVVVAILLMTMPLSLAGCASTQGELQSRVTNLEQKLSTAESTIKILEQRIEGLEKANQQSLTETDVLITMQRKRFWAKVGNNYMQIRFGECISLSE